MILNAADGAKQGYKNILIRTVDSDVVVLAISFANRIECEKLTVAFGIGESFRYLDVSRMALVLGDRKSHILSIFYALTDCDTTSTFAGRGKRTAWTTWSKFADVSPALRKLAQAPTAADVEEVIPDIGRFVVLMYDQGSSDDSVNKARKTLFTSKKREIENIPPTQDALRHHVLRVAYQAGHVWGQALLRAPHLPRLTYKELV